VAAAEAAFSHRAEMNGLATLGKWTPDMESTIAQRS
jgi:fructose-bisphosphate aldolase class I